MKKFALSVFVLAVSASAYGQDDAFEPMSIEDFVLTSTPYGVGAMSKYPADGKYYVRLVGGNKIVRYSYADAEDESTMYSSESINGLANVSWNGFELSKDCSKILLWEDSEPIYRYSFKANYYVADVVSSHTVKLSEEGGEEIATMSPNGRYIAYVKDNNVYVKEFAYEDDSQGLHDKGTKQVTKDGKKNSVIYAVPDWVYQEEFGILNSFTWSPDGKSVAFLRWDESEVPMYSMTMYEGDCNPDASRSLYPGSYDYKYPVAGEKNSVVTVWCYNVETGALSQMELPKTDEDYIPHLSFAGRNDALMVMKLNRTQNDMVIYNVNPAGGKCVEVYKEHSKSWIDSELARSVTYTADGFVIPSERNGWAHLYKVTGLDDGGHSELCLTKGNEAVTAYYGYDSKRKLHYYQRTAGALNRVVCSVDENGKENVLGKNKGNTSARFSSDFSYYIEVYSDACTPTQYRVCKANGKRVKDLQLNLEYAERYAKERVPRREFFTFSSDGYDLNGYTIKPLDFDKNKKYPVIMSQYSGPGSQQVLNKWKMDWETWFAMNGYVVCCVDGRGTGGRGKDFESLIYMNLGKYETIDQIAAARYMAQQPYVDASKIGIWGWSYGGYEALMAMSQKNSPYAAGVSIAPVTSWRFYDTIYAERFMRTPQENGAGYDAGAPLKLVDNLKGNLLLMFGSADDNVHIINSMQYIAKLHGNGNQFEMMVYPNMNHSINGCGVRAPLYQRVLNFFDRNLKK